ncbi:MAG TPA: hypothetical protein VE860_03080 [Chthoniobacterales bacterium]|nr:hypothetical protein [Chthoniobacterales bacterium]
MLRFYWSVKTGASETGSTGIEDDDEHEDEYDQEYAKVYYRHRAPLRAGE